MPSFSERTGLVKIRDTLQVDKLLEGTRTRIANAFRQFYLGSLVSRPFSSGIFDGTFHGATSEVKYLLKILWDAELKWDHALLETNTPNKVTKALSSYFSEAPWNRIMDFIEAVLKYDSTGNCKNFEKKINLIFEEENVGYRILEKQVIPIISDIEINDIENALNTPFEAINFHIQTALIHLSNRDEPDYRNSIKESISAVECICKIIIGNRKTTLGQALKGLEESGVEIHSALREGFSKLYGWTSADEGIRHAMMDMSSVDQDDARYMLVTCSAFVNYLLAESNKAGINLQVNWESI